jgi:hypothetical protein
MKMFAPITVPVTADQYKRAYERQQAYLQNYADRGMPAPHDSLRDGKGHMVGSLCEIVQFDYFLDTVVTFANLLPVVAAKGYRWPAAHQETVNFDMTSNATDETTDVKGKERDDPPLAHYLASVTDANKRQQCDFYSFASSSDDLRKVHLIGYISRADFERYAKFAKKGEFDVTSSPRKPFHFRCDCWNVPYSILTPFTPVKSRSVPRLHELTH